MASELRSYLLGAFGSLKSGGKEAECKFCRQLKKVGRISRNVIMFGSAEILRYTFTQLCLCQLGTFFASSHLRVCEPNKDEDVEKLRTFLSKGSSIKASLKLGSFSHTLSSILEEHDKRYSQIHLHATYAGNKFEDCRHCNSKVFVESRRSRVSQYYQMHWLHCAFIKQATEALLSMSPMPGENSRLVAGGAPYALVFGERF